MACFFSFWSLTLRRMETSKGPEAPSTKTVKSEGAGERRGDGGLLERYFKISAMFRWTPELACKSWMRTTNGWVGGCAVRRLGAETKKSGTEPNRAGIVSGIGERLPKPVAKDGLLINAGTRTTETNLTRHLFIVPLR